jgi:hypothetical protein
MLLMYERLRGADSFWAPYINILPTTYDHTLTYTESELTQLQDPFLHYITEGLNAEIKRDQEKILGNLRSYAIPNFDNYTTDLFRWAWYTVGSRCFQFAGVSSHTLGKTIYCFAG